MVLLGHIYRGRKPVHWSPSSQTALAEAELEVHDFLVYNILLMYNCCHIKQNRCIHPYDFAINKKRIKNRVFLNKDCIV